MDQRLKGKVALVTGGASGIGEAIATLFAKHGAVVAIADRQEDRGRKVTAILMSNGGNAACFAVDLSEAVATEALVPRVVSELGGLDVLVNGAGLFGWMNKKSAGDTPPEIWDQTMRVNLDAPLRLTRAAIPAMAARGGGSIINIASIGGLNAFPEFAAYSVSKAALIQLTKSVALDYGRLRIRANAICPGAIDTPGNDPFINDRPAYEELIASVTPLGRPGVPMEVAWAALYLASEESSYVTGTTLVVDGGRRARA